MTLKKIKICAFTGTRADYPRIKSVLTNLKNDRIFDLKIVVTGSHLLKSAGDTYKEILDDGFKIDFKVKMFDDPPDDSLYGNSKAFSRCSSGIADILKDYKPDLALVTVDRVETLAIASICALMNIPIAHVQGGEVSGTIDESIRHAVTKLSHIHFVATNQAKKRIIKLGENPKHVFNVGCPYIDIIDKQKKVELDMNFPKPFGIFTMHSVTTDLKEARLHFVEVSEAVKTISNEFFIFAFIPNTDPGRNYILSKLKTNNNIKVVNHLRSNEFIFLMKNASFMFGNSSAGIREAASFKLPVINIGSRQQGREHSTNVVHCGFDKKEILKKIRYILTNSTFRKKLNNCKNIYGDGKSAKKIIKKLKEVDISSNILQKRFFG